jgi:hypothetical protein
VFKLDVINAFFKHKFCRFALYKLVDNTDTVFSVLFAAYKVDVRSEVNKLVSEAVWLVMLSSDAAWETTMF